MKWKKPNWEIVVLILFGLGVLVYFCIMYRFFEALYGFFTFILLVFLYGTGGSL